MLQCFVLFSVWLLGQVSTAANPCTANPCGKNGFCQVRQQAPGYVCGCLPGHTGVHCKGGAPQCALGGLRNVCKNGGTCYIHGTKTLRCLCPPGYVGSKCEEELLELTCPADSWGFSMGKEPVQFSQSNSCTDLIAAVPKWNTMDYYRIYCQHFTNATSLPEQASQVRMSMCYEVDQGAVLKSDLCCKRTLKSDPNNIFVHNINGSDTDLCGRQETPCKTVKHALIRVPNGGTIYVMGSKGYSYKECSVFANAMTINISVEIVGINNPVFECVFDIIHKGYSLFHIHSNNGLQKVTLNGLSFLKAVILSKNVDLTVQNCYFMESSIRGKDHKFPQNLRLLSSNFESSHVLIDKTGPIDLKSQDSKFHNSTFTILAIENIKARFLRTNFTIKPLVLHMETSQSQNNALNLDIELNACEFRTVGTSGAEKDSNGTTDTQAALQLEYKSSQSRFSLTSKLLIQSCVFRDNSRAIGLAGFLREVVIKDTTFHNNSVEGNGGAIAFKIVRRASLIITNCDFSINKATAHSSAVVGQSGTLTGRGGAIYAIEYEPHSQMTTTSKIILANDRFVGNQADSKGGTLYFGEDIDSTIMGTRIMGASNATTKVEGELLYIQSSAEIASSQMLTVTRPHRQISVISISGTSGNSYSVAANVQCPIGYNLTYSHGTMNMSEQSQNLQLICVTCDFGLVSLQQGEMNITSLSFVDDKVTLESTSNADTFTCKSCPNGAICEDDGHLVKMAPNHWGILKDGTLSVQRCPIGYCCTGDTCGTFSDCAENRGGVLCGQCANDFSPSFFSSTCVDNTTCSAWWLWILAVICGIIILSITIFNQQLFHVVMILWMPIWGLFKRCNCCLRCQSEHVDPNENEDKFSDNGKSMSNNNQERRPKKKGVRFDAPQSAEDLYKERIHEHYGYLDSVVYLLQTAFLIHISHSSDSDQMTLIIDELGKIAYNIANFRFLFEYPKDVCLFEGANRAVLEIVHAVVILVVFLFLSFAYVIYMCVEDSLNERPKGVGVFVELGYEVHPTLGFIHIIETVFIHWIPTIFLLLIFLTAFILGIIGRIRACRQAEVERSIDGSSIQETPSIRDYPSFNSQSTLYRMHEPMGGQTEIEASLGGFDLSPNRDPDMLDFEIELFSQGDEDIQRGDAGMHSISLGGVTEDMGHC
ncbi:unnamed protein product [Owenia fusiformis]|uniref:Uncharacterized protein n=1 Tax=Owenia fusiformis TaxID=6347 RepID=A0A8J1T4P9_OWEFU|nr:unnamed protein product [Owenia fusiformis]